MADEDAEPEKCDWCEQDLRDGEGFEFEPDDGSPLRAGLFCSTDCLIAAA
jgi:ribosomal protein L24E